MDEVAALTPRLRRRQLTSGSAGAACSGRSTADGVDAPILYEHEFTRPGGLGAFAALPVQGAGR